MPSALLVAAVAAIMLAGALLQSSGRTEFPRPQAGASPPAAPLPLGSTITPEIAPDSPAPSVAAEPAPLLQPAARATATATPPRAEPELPVEVPPLVLKLATRAEVDCDRLAKARGPWTAQLLVACKPETVERLLGAAQGSTRVYVLPARVKDDACFRVCFGDYATATEAALAADLPTTLRGKDRIGAVAIAKVLP